MQKKLIGILARALHEYVNFVHDPEKQYRSLSACWNAGVLYILIKVYVESNRGKPPVKKKSVQRARKKQKVCTIHADFLKKPRSLKNTRGFFRALA